MIYICATLFRWSTFYFKGISPADLFLSITVQRCVACYFHQRRYHLASPANVWYPAGSLASIIQAQSINPPQIFSWCTRSTPPWLSLGKKKKETWFRKWLVMLVFNHKLWSSWWKLCLRPSIQPPTLEINTSSSWIIDQIALHCKCVEPWRVSAWGQMVYIYI